MIKHYFFLNCNQNKSKNVNKTFCFVNPINKALKNYSKKMTCHLNTVQKVIINYFKKKFGINVAKTN